MPFTTVVDVEAGSVVVVGTGGDSHGRVKASTEPKSGTRVCLTQSRRERKSAKDPLTNAASSYTRCCGIDGATPQRYFRGTHLLLFLNIQPIEAVTLHVLESGGRLSSSPYSRPARVSDVPPGSTSERVELDGSEAEI